MNYDLCYLMDLMTEPEISESLKLEFAVIVEKLKNKRSC